MITLGMIAAHCGVPCDPRHESVPIDSVTSDSRAVGPGSLFVCITGLKTDGHRFLPAAIDAGASAAIVTRLPEVPLRIPVLLVDNGRRCLGLTAALLAGNPSRHLDLIGVTGTNGKTTTTYFIRSILRTAGRSAELIGTTGYSVGEVMHKLDHTTPESTTIQGLLGKLLDLKTDSCIIEVSSHAVALERIAGATFRAGVFTNITDREHLDFHRTFEAYRSAKMQFFQDYIASGSNTPAIINLDDPNSRYFIEASGKNVLTYSRQGSKMATVKAEHIVPGIFGVSFDMITPEAHRRLAIRLPGIFNVDNALAAATTALALNVDIEHIVTGLERIEFVPGRFQSVEGGQDFAVIVDYAHTDDALKNLLQGARSCRPKRLITVFGCGGDRDRTKRPRMGQIAAEMSDHLVVTSDNPRSEDPDSIIGMILAGIENAGRTTVIPDRAEAIRAAIAMAERGDMVVIAGKGHEDYQIFADRTIHFDDREQALDAIRHRTRERG